MKHDPVRVLEERLGEQFVDPELLLGAITHKSYAVENDTESHMERFEWVGDSVLNAATSLLIFERFPGISEGDMSKIRNRLVNSSSLVRIAESLDLETCILLGKGERKQWRRSRDRILEDAVEAIAGAVQQDRGFEAVRALAAQWMNAAIEQLAERYARRGRLAIEHPKSALQELTQERFAGVTPEYVDVAAEGADHDLEFFVEVRLEDRVLATGRGSTKQRAQVQAAEDALALLLEEDA